MEYEPKIELGDVKLEQQISNYDRTDLITDLTLWKIGSELAEQLIANSKIFYI